MMDSLWSRSCIGSLMESFTTSRALMEVSYLQSQSGDWDFHDFTRLKCNKFLMGLKLWKSFDDQLCWLHLLASSDRIRWLTTDTIIHNFLCHLWHVLRMNFNAELLFMILHVDLIIFPCYQGLGMFWSTPWCIYEPNFYHFQANLHDESNLIEFLSWSTL